MGREGALSDLFGSGPEVGFPTNMVTTFENKCRRKEVWQRLE